MKLLNVELKNDLFLQRKEIDIILIFCTYAFKNANIAGQSHFAHISSFHFKGLCFFLIFYKFLFSTSFNTSFSIYLFQSEIDASCIQFPFGVSTANLVLSSDSFYKETFSNRIYSNSIHEIKLLMFAQFSVS